MCCLHVAGSVPAAGPNWGSRQATPSEASSDAEDSAAFGTSIGTSGFHGRNHSHFGVSCGSVSSLRPATSCTVDPGCSAIAGPRLCNREMCPIDTAALQLPAQEHLLNCLSLRQAGPPGCGRGLSAGSILHAACSCPRGHRSTGRRGRHGRQPCGPAPCRRPQVSSFTWEHAAKRTAAAGALPCVQFDIAAFTST
jgi:hypothetical protein